MTRLGISIALFVALLFVGGCTEPFAAGFGTGVATMAAMADDSQERFMEAVNVLNEETAKINEGVGSIEGSILVKPETLAAMKSLKGREKDPVFWTALLSVLVNAGVIGNTYAKSKKKPE